jgi:hypothetical protein
MGNAHCGQRFGEVVAQRKEAFGREGNVEEGGTQGEWVDDVFQFTVVGLNLKGKWLQFC